MVQDSFFNLISPSNKFWLNYMSGKAIGRKLKLWNYFHNYMTFFYELTTNLFRYEGISRQLVREIEKRLFYFGEVGIISHFGRLTAVTVNTYQPDVYGRPEMFTFCFENGAKDSMQYRRTINENGVWGVNTYERNATSLVAEQYALIAAHCDTSMVNFLVNTRIEEILKVQTEQEAEKAKAYYNKIYEGDSLALIDKLEDMEINRPTGSQADARGILEIKDRAIKDFYNLFGINRFEEKKERVVTDEVNANSTMLRLNVEDMFEMRKETCENIEKVFGLPVDVYPLVDIDGDNVTEQEEEMEEEAQEGGAENV